MKNLIYLVVFALGTGFVSCSDDDKSTNEGVFTNWQARNDSAFTAELRAAKKFIATAKATYGDAWENHCDYRLFPTYQASDNAKLTSTDTIVVRITQHGTGSAVTPLFSDSVRVNYLGRTIPVSTSPKGYVFDYSGTRSDSASIFNPNFSQPTKFAVGGVVAGLSTAFQHMGHIGDTWRVYIPYKLGYNTTATTNLPAYTNLIFDVQLKGVYRKGNVAVWK